MYHWIALQKCGTDTFQQCIPVPTDRRTTRFFPAASNLILMMSHQRQIIENTTWSGSRPLFLSCSGLVQSRCSIDANCWAARSSFRSPLTVLPDSYRRLEERTRRVSLPSAPWVAFILPRKQSSSSTLKRGKHQCALIEQLSSIFFFKNYDPHSETFFASPEKLFTSLCPIPSQIFYPTLFQCINLQTLNSSCLIW